MLIKFTFLYYVAWESLSRLNEIQTEIMKKLKYIHYSLMTVILLYGEARYQLQNLEGNVSITDSVANRDPYTLNSLHNENNRTRTFDGNERPRAAPADIINIILEGPVNYI